MHCLPCNIHYILYTIQLYNAYLCMLRRFQSHVSSMSQMTIIIKFKHVSRVSVVIKFKHVSRVSVVIKFKHVSRVSVVIKFKHVSRVSVVIKFKHVSRVSVVIKFKHVCRVSLLSLSTCLECRSLLISLSIRHQLYKVIHHTIMHNNYI